MGSVATLSAAGVGARPQSSHSPIERPEHDILISSRSLVPPQPPALTTDSFLR